MASSVQFENTYPEDERWLEAGPAAFALHFGAACYADRRNTDGRIPKTMVTRVALAVPEEDVPAAVEALLAAGFWRSAGKDYVIVDYLEDKIGLPAEEKLANRSKWAADKRRRRRHNAGNHDECTPDKCRQSGKVSTGDSTTDSAGTPPGTLDGSPDGVHMGVSGLRNDPIRPDSTRPDYGVGGEGESRALPSGPASAGAPAYPVVRGVRVTPDVIGGVDPHGKDPATLVALLRQHGHLPPPAVTLATGTDG